MAPIPLIEVTQQLARTGQPLTPAGRTLVALLGLVLLVVWGLAAWLEPDARGYGTHERLGLPPCSFQQLTGRPCPSCGMTTAFARLAHGQLIASAQANPGGFLVALISLVLAPWSLASAKQGHLIGVTAPDRALLVLLLPIIGVSLAAWLLRLAFGF